MSMFTAPLQNRPHGRQSSPHGCQSRPHRRHHRFPARQRRFPARRRRFAGNNGHFSGADIHFAGADTPFSGANVHFSRVDVHFAPITVQSSIPRGHFPPAAVISPVTAVVLGRTRHFSDKTTDFAVLIADPAVTQSTPRSHGGHGGIALRTRIGTSLNSV